MRNNTLINIQTIDYSLYVVIDEGWIRDRELKRLTEDLISGGATILQYRNKSGADIQFYEHAKLIHGITKSNSIPFIVNDRVDIALAIDAEGVHVGQQDLPEFTVRELMGPDKCLGVSISHIEELKNIQFADYLGVGAMFKTQSKSDAEYGGLQLMKLVREMTELPLVGIGGITFDNAASVINAGADGVALISVILGSESPLQAIKRMEDIIVNAKSGKSKESV